MNKLIHTNYSVFLFQMRCLLNIWGVMLFLRLTWVVGQAGLSKILQFFDNFKFLALNSVHFLCGAMIQSLVLTI